MFKYSLYAMFYILYPEGIWQFDYVFYSCGPWPDLSFELEWWFYVSQISRWKVLCLKPYTNVSFWSILYNFEVTNLQVCFFKSIIFYLYFLEWGFFKLKRFENVISGDFFIYSCNDSSTARSSSCEKCSLIIYLYSFLRSVYD